MTPFTDSDSFDSQVNEYDTTDPVQGGVGGQANNPLQSLANRTRWLYNEIGSGIRSTLGESLLVFVQTLAPKLSPIFTGQPTAPTAQVGDNTQELATTAFTQAAKGLAQVAVSGTSNVTLTAPQYGGQMVQFYGTLTAQINAIFPTLAQLWLIANATSQTIVCKTAGGSGVPIGAGVTALIWGDGTNINVVSPQQVTTTVNNTTANPFSPPQGHLSGNGPGWWWWDPNTGYTKVWVTLARSVSSEGAFTVQFPIIFGNAQVAVSTADNSAQSNSANTTMQKVQLTNSELTVFAQDSQGNSSAYATGVDFVIEGYTSSLPSANPSYVPN